MAEHPLVQLARQTIASYVRSGDMPPVPTELTPEMRRQAGVFVSLHMRGDLRGCVGTFSPQQDNVALEVMHNAVAAAAEDPRFNPVREKELAELDISVDVLSKPEPVASLDDLDPSRYGAIVASGWRRGLLLPDLEGVDTAEQQVAICRRKGGIGRHDPVQLYRFTVERYH